LEGPLKITMFLLHNYKVLFLPPHIKLSTIMPCNFCMREAGGKASGRELEVYKADIQQRRTSQC